jgi:L-galactose dehydrogenase
MEHQTLGRTGLRVSALAYGASPLGGAFGDVSDADGARCVHAAIDGGINFVDVSPYYGLTKAETVLGKALVDIKRDRYFLATKVGRYDSAEFDFSAERVTRSVDESLARLRVEHIDLIQCHDIEFGDLQQVIDETLPALRKLRDNGKVRFIGVTGYPLNIFRTVLDASEVDTILSYCHYALNDTTLASLLPYLKKKGVGIINAAPLSMGLLSHGGPQPWHPASREMKETCARAVKFCEQRGVEIERLAIQFAVANPDIATTVVGTASADQIKRNIEWANSRPDEAMIAEVREILKPIQDQTWPTGRPENA